jgi:hypothetical protein
MMGQLVTPWQDIPVAPSGSKARESDRNLASERHLGQQDKFCTNRPNIRLQPPLTFYMLQLAF